MPAGGNEKRTWATDIALESLHQKGWVTVSVFAAPAI